MRLVRAVVTFLLFEACGFGYSVLSHEAVIDALWANGLQPALLKRFPHAAPEELRSAHAYAYGGAILQDMGFYPHGNGYFSDLTHYVRSGDFIRALLKDSQTLDEYAFALGALSHYASDNDGHRMATNVGEPLLYPELGRKFGSVVTYEDDPDKHLQTEYAFDVEEVAKGNFAPQAYHDFIGFNVASPLLERAFQETYGFDVREMYDDFERAIGSYRHTLSTLIPFFTRVAWVNHEDEIKRAEPGITKKKFLYVMKRSTFEREWGRDYDRPSLWDRIIAFLVKLLPPIGKLKILKFRTLTPEVEQLFMKSFGTVTREYRAQICAGHALELGNSNFDLGEIAGPGKYRLEDEAYAYWLDKLAQRNFRGVTPEIEQDLLAFYRDLNAPIATKKHAKDWKRLLSQLEGLKRTYSGVAEAPRP